LIIQSVEAHISPVQLDADVDLRMGRQVKVFDGPVRETTFIIDEMAIARMPGSVAGRRSQIARLLAPPEQAAIRVVPFSVGPHPALGTFVIFDFDSDVIPSGVYVEGSVVAKGLVETGDAVAAYENVWALLQAKALSPQDTREFLEAKLKGITTDDER
jgi:hypothetical protein